MTFDKIMLCLALYCLIAPFIALVADLIDMSREFNKDLDAYVAGEMDVQTVIDRMKEREEWYGY